MNNEACRSAEHDLELRACLKLNARCGPPWHHALPVEAHEDYRQVILQELLPEELAGASSPFDGMRQSWCHVERTACDTAEVEQWSSLPRL